MKCEAQTLSTPLKVEGIDKETCTMNATVFSTSSRIGSTGGDLECFGCGDPLSVAVPTSAVYCGEDASDHFLYVDPGGSIQNDTQDVINTQ